MAKSLFDAVYGSILGGAIGDALGAPALLDPFQRSRGEVGLSRKRYDGDLWERSEG
jgi:ADP-ribosylglycohydrolase